MTKIRVKKGDGEDPPLTYEQRKHWNDYVDFLEKKGYKGSPLLDKKETGLAKSLFDEYLKENPTSALNYSHVKSVQNEMQQLQKSAQEFEARHGNKDASKIMEGISKPDGWPGSKTTKFKFPQLIVKDYLNNALTSSKNLGVVDPKFQAASLSSMKKPLPKGIKLEPLYDAQGKQYGMGYTDPETGDVIQQ